MMLSRIVTGFVLMSAVVMAQTAPAPKPGAGHARHAVKQNAPVAAGAQRTESKPARSHRRDPFVSIIQTHTASGPVCAAGKKCLAINQIVLKGIARSPEGMLALVENGQHKSYFLRENDPVFNGHVVRTTQNSIVFRERVVDRLGRESKRDIVKTLPGAKPA
jgi:hypothetical protein